MAFGRLSRILLQVAEFEPTQSLQDAIYREKVERARNMTVGERLAAGQEQFEEVVSRMKIGIRMRFPDADEVEVARLLAEQMNRIRSWKERDLYRSV